MVEPIIVAEPVIKTPHPVNQVTPLSKYLALVIFVTLPFVGAYIGYQLAPEKVVEVQVMTTEIQPAAVETKTVSTNTVRSPERILFNGEITGYVINDGKLFYTPFGVSASGTVSDGSDLRPVPDADPATFRVIASEPNEVGTLFAIDSMQAYSGEQVLQNVDVATVETFGKGNAFLISDKGLYLWKTFITAGKKTDLEVYAMSNNGEAMSPFNVYVHNKITNTWLSAIDKGDIKTISAPKASQLLPQFKMYPNTATSN